MFRLLIAVAASLFAVAAAFYSVSRRTQERREYRSTADTI